MPKIQKFLIKVTISLQMCMHTKYDARGALVRQSFVNQSFACD